MNPFSRTGPRSFFLLATLLLSLNAAGISRNYVTLTIAQSQTEGIRPSTNYTLKIEANCSTEANVTNVVLRRNGTPLATWNSGMGFYGDTNAAGYFSAVYSRDWQLAFSQTTVTGTVALANGTWVLEVAKNGAVSTVSFTPTLPDQDNGLFLSLPSLVSPSLFEDVGTSEVDFQWTNVDAEASSWINVWTKQRLSVSDEAGDTQYEYANGTEYNFTPTDFEWAPGSLGDGIWEWGVSYAQSPATNALSALIRDVGVTGPIVWKPDPTAPSDWPQDGTPFLISQCERRSEFCVHPHSAACGSNYVHVILGHELKEGLLAATNYNTEVEIGCGEADILAIELRHNDVPVSSWTPAQGYYGTTNEATCFTSVKEGVWKLENTYASYVDAVANLSQAWSVAVVLPGETNTLSFNVFLPEIENYWDQPIPALTSPACFASLTTPSPVLEWTLNGAEDRGLCQPWVVQRTCVTNASGSGTRYGYANEQKTLLSPYANRWTPQPLGQGTWECGVSYVRFPTTDMLPFLITDVATSGTLSWNSSPYAPEDWPQDGTPLLISVGTQERDFSVVQATQNSNYIHLLLERTDRNSLWTETNGNYTVSVEAHCYEGGVAYALLSRNGAAIAEWSQPMGYYDWTNASGCFAEVATNLWRAEIPCFAADEAVTRANGNWSLTLVKNGQSNTVAFTLTLPSDQTNQFLSPPDVTSPVPFATVSETLPTIAWTNSLSDDSQAYRIEIERRTRVSDGGGNWGHIYSDPQSAQLGADATAWSPSTALAAGVWELTVSRFRCPTAEERSQILSNVSATGNIVWGPSPFAPADWPQDGSPLLASVGTSEREFAIGSSQGQAAPPAFTPSTGHEFYDATLFVSVSNTTDDAAIRYTLDGSEPTVYSLPYSGPIDRADQHGDHQGESFCQRFDRQFDRLGDLHQHPVHANDARPHSAQLARRLRPRRRRRLRGGGVHGFGP